MSIDIDYYENLPRKDSFTKDGWWEVGKLVRPELTREEFDAQWEQFIQAKAMMDGVGGSA